MHSGRDRYYPDRPAVRIAMPGNMHATRTTHTVAVSVAAARETGQFDQYAEVAVSQTPLYLFVPSEAYLSIHHAGTELDDIADHDSTIVVTAKEELERYKKDQTEDNMDTITIDINKVREKEKTGERPTGTADAILAKSEGGGKDRVRIYKEDWLSIVSKRKESENVAKHASLLVSSALSSRPKPGLPAEIQVVQELMKVSPDAATAYMKNNPDKFKTESPAKTKGSKCELQAGKPGYVLHEMIKRITGQDMTPNCSCCKKAKELDRKGWLWCISHRNEIRDYMMEQAKKRGFEIDEEKTWKTFAATAVQMIKERSRGESNAND
jgi:hypothetical protein